MKSAKPPRDLDDGVKVGELARGLLGINLLSIDGDLKNAAACGNEFQRADVLFELQEFFRQTDGLRLVVSCRAVFDGDVQSHIGPCRTEDYAPDHSTVKRRCGGGISGGGRMNERPLAQGNFSIRVILEIRGSTSSFWVPGSFAIRRNWDFVSFVCFC